MNRHGSIIQMNEPDTVVITQVSTLKEAIIGWFDDEMRQRSNESDDIMLDQAVVMKRLGKSRATLLRWDKSGYLTCYKRGGRNQYRLSDVERIEKGKGYGEGV